MSSLLRRVRFSGGGSGDNSGSDSGSGSSPLASSRSDSRAWLDPHGGVFLVGKHEGEAIERVRRDDPGYLRWIVDQVEDICEGDRDIIEAALRRRG